MEKNIKKILKYIGEDPEREGLKETPNRMMRAWGELFSGYKQDPKDVFKIFDATYDQLVLLRNCSFFSTCEHHFMSFYGVAHIAYIPSPNCKKVIGISKLARLLEIYSRRLQIQERIGEQITNDLMTYLNPIGAACVLEASHLCVQSRGVKKSGSVMVTSSMKGVFLEQTQRGIAARAELMGLIKK